MAHEFGAIALPVPLPSEPDEVADLALDVIAEAFPVILGKWLNSAWSFIAPGEPLFRRVHTHDPRENDFVDTQLPALFVYRDDAGRSAEFQTDGSTALESTINVLWVAPPATQDKSAIRSRFFQAFVAAITTLVDNESDPSWVRAGDTDDASLTYGSSIVDHANFDWWAIPDREAFSRPTIQIKADGERIVYHGMLARLSVLESTDVDVTKLGPVPVDSNLKIQTAAPDPLVILELLGPSLGVSDVAAGGTPVTAGGIQVTASS